MFTLKSSINKSLLNNKINLRNYLNNFNSLNITNNFNPVNSFITLNKKQFSNLSGGSQTPEPSQVEKPKLKIINPNQNSNSNNIAESYYPVGDIPFFTLKKSSFKKRPKGTIPAIKTGDLDYSSDKLNNVCKLIRGKYIRNAIEILQAENTKGARIIREELEEYLEKVEKKRKKQEENLMMRIRKRETDLEENSGEFEIKTEEENSDRESNEADTKENLEKSLIDKPVNLSEETEFVPYLDYKIVEAYVGRKRGHKVPSPRAKGKMDLITRNISRLYVHIEKVKPEKFFEEVALGKADVTFAYNTRRKLFMSGASLSTLKNFSFITTAKGRYYRQQQFQRLVTFLRKKYYKEKGIKLNSEIVANKLKSRLGKELAKFNPTRFESPIPATLKPSYFTNNVYNKLALNRIKTKLGKETPKLPDRSLQAREKHFNKNFKKVE